MIRRRSKTTPEATTDGKKAQRETDTGAITRSAGKKSMDVRRGATGSGMSMLIPPPQRLSRVEANSRSMLALAHVGDAVYELLVRGSLTAGSTANVNELHRSTVSHVRAEAQAQAAMLLQDSLSEEESEVYRRGRNCRVHGIPAHASPGDYHSATGLEALFGWLYLTGEIERIEELFRIIQEGNHGALG